MLPDGSGTQGETRLRSVLVVIVCLFATLLIRLVFLQTQRAAATQQLQSVSYLTVYIPAPRGEILDRQGRVLVGNRQIPEIEVQRQDASNPAVVSMLAALLGQTTAAMRAAINNNQYLGVAPVPVALATPAEMLYIEEHRSLFPGVTAATVSVPYATRLGVYAGNIVGYVGQITGPELAAYTRQFPGAHYQAGDVVGQAGIEAEYQQYLNGRPGVDVYEVNATGQVLRLVKSVPPVPGDNVVLTINGAMQRVADQSLLQGQAVARTQVDPNGTGHYKAPGGAAVVEDPNNGQVLTLASEPYFNPNLFNNGITPAQLRALGSIPNNETDLAIQGAFAPGSTFKVATATAGLYNHIITPSYIFNDTRGYMVVAGHVFKDDAGIGAGYINLAQALTVSSDNYFNTIGMKLWYQRAKLGPLAFQKAAYGYGFGLPTGINLPGGNTNAGLIPTPAQQVALKKAQPNNPYALGYWVVGDSIEMAIGQFQVEVTPLQLADAYSTFANGGTRYRPQIVLRITSPSGKVVKSFPPVVVGHSEPLSPADRQAMIQGYLGVTHNPLGTGYPVFAHTALAGEQIAGKTGTAQNSCTGCQPTSVFQGFAPASAPKYEVDAFVQEAGYGESIAAPIVRRIYDYIYHKPLMPIAYQPAGVP